MVVLGMMSKMPVAGVVWQYLHYLLGFERLGFEPYYVEAHAGTPSMLMREKQDDSSRLATEFLARVLDPFGFAGRWAFNALHDDGQVYGMSAESLSRVYRSAEFLINLHGGTRPTPELAATGRLVYLETDPVQLQLELHREVPETVEFLEQHSAFFSFAECWGRPSCGLPVSGRFDFRPTRQPVVVDLWEDAPSHSNPAFTTVGNWKQDWKTMTFKGETYSWSKHHNFLRYLDLPQHTDQPLELALASCDPPDRALLKEHGWRLREPSEMSADIDAYRVVHLGFARRVHRGQGAERTPADRLVQRPQRHLPGGGSPGGHRGDRLLRGYSHGRRAVRLRERGGRRQTPWRPSAATTSTTAARPQRSPTSGSATRPFWVACWPTSVFGFRGDGAEA